MMVYLLIKLKPWICFLVAFLKNVLGFKGLMSTPQKWSSGVSLDEGVKGLLSLEKEIICGERAGEINKWMCYRPEEWEGEVGFSQSQK